MNCTLILIATLYLNPCEAIDMRQDMDFATRQEVCVVNGHVVQGTCEEIAEQINQQRGN